MEIEGHFQQNSKNLFENIQLPKQMISDLLKQCQISLDLDNQLTPNINTNKQNQGFTISFVFLFNFR